MSCMNIMQMHKEARSDELWETQLLLTFVEQKFCLLSVVLY